MKDFNDCILLNGICDIGFTGHPFTWAKGNEFEQRLDRILFNSAWIDMFQQSSVKHGILKGSDHRPLLVNAHSNSGHKVGSFKFQNMWVLHPGFLQAAQNNWTLPARNVGLKKIKQKLYRLKLFLTQWNKTEFGNVFFKVKQLEGEIATAEWQVANFPSVANSDILKTKQLLFSSALDQEEAYWKQKASASWCTQGERNTALFHNMVKRKRARMALIVLCIRIWFTLWTLILKCQL